MADMEENNNKDKFYSTWDKVKDFASVVKNLLVGGTILVVFILAFTGRFDDLVADLTSGGSSAGSSVSKRLRGDDERDNSIYVGETAANDAIEVTLKDVGDCYQSGDLLYSPEYADGYIHNIYVELEIKNISGQVLEFDGDDFEAYIGNSNIWKVNFIPLPFEDGLYSRSGNVLPGSTMNLMYSTAVDVAYRNTDGDLSIVFDGNLVIPVADADGWKSINYKLKPYIDAWNNPEESDIITAKNKPEEPEPEIDPGAYGLKSLYGDDGDRGEQFYYVGDTIYGAEGIYLYLKDAGFMGYDSAGEELLTMEMYTQNPQTDTQCLIAFLELEIENTSGKYYTFSNSSLNTLTVNGNIWGVDGSVKLPHADDVAQSAVEIAPGTKASFMWVTRLPDISVFDIESMYLDAEDGYIVFVENGSDITPNKRWYSGVY